MRRPRARWANAWPLDARAIWRMKREWIRANRIRSKPEHNYQLGPGVVLLFHGTDPAHCVCNGTHLARWCPRCPG